MKTRTLIVSIIALTIASPASADDRDCKRTRATDAIGRIFGDYIGRKTGIRSRDVSVIFSEVFACLTDTEKRQSKDTEMDSLNGGQSGTGSRREWRSTERKRVGGGTEVEERTASNGQQCAITRTFVTDVDGEEVSVRHRRCQRPDGSWSDAEPL